MFKKILLGAFALLSVSISCNAHAANLVLDGNFDTPYGGATSTLYSAGQSFGAWTVYSGTVDLVGGYWQNPTDLTQSPPYGSVDLDGTSPGTIYQNLQLNPGNYLLTFSFSGNPDQLGLHGFNVYAGTTGGSYAYNVTSAISHSYMGYVTESMAFNVSGSGTQTVPLAFASSDAADSSFGGVIGNISVVEVSAVPLPASLPLLGVGLLGLGLFAVRRRQNI